MLNAHLRDMPNHIREYQLCIPENVDIVQVTNFTEKTSFFDPHLTPQDKMKSHKPYCTYTKHTELCARASFAHFLKCSSDRLTKKLMFWRSIDSSSGYVNPNIRDIGLKRWMLQN